jgi:hypothetical protein
MVQGSVASLTIVRYPPPQGDHADRQLRSASNEVVTAALLVIGGKILSGRTKGQNVGYIAEYLTALGIDLKEVRVVGDEERARRTQCAAEPAGSGLGPRHGANTNVVSTRIERS